MSTRKHFTVTVKKWRKGWEVHIDGAGVTQARHLAEVKERASDYIWSLLDDEATSIDLSFDFAS